MRTEIIPLKCPCCGNTFTIDPSLDKQVVKCDCCDTNLLILDNDVYKRSDNNFEFCYSFGSSNEHATDDFLNNFMNNFFKSDDDYTVHISYKSKSKKDRDEAIIQEKEQEFKKRELEINERHKKEKQKIIILMLQLFEMFCCILIIIYTFNIKSWRMLWYGIPGVITSGYGLLLSLSHYIENSVYVDEYDKFWSIASIVITGILLISFVKAAVS